LSFIYVAWGPLGVLSLGQSNQLAKTYPEAERGPLQRMNPELGRPWQASPLRLGELSKVVRLLAVRKALARDTSAR